MASISSRDGRRIIQFFLGPSRKTVRLGKVPKKFAESVRTHVEHLIAAKSLAQPIASATATWLGEIDSTIYDRLASTGLVSARTETSLFAFVDQYITGSPAKPGTLATWRRVQKDLDASFTGRSIESITPEELALWASGLRGRLAESTVRKRTKIARQFFEDAVKRGLITTNPLTGLLTHGGEATDRRRYVDRETAQKLIDASPCGQWRLLIALARFGGLRCPSEACRLRYEDVDHKAGKILIRSPKTEHHEGRDSRLIPLFPEISEHLTEGNGLVIDRYSSDSNLRTTFAKICDRAGVDRLPKPFTNLRSSAATDLVERFPPHVVNSWLGHSEEIARQHYRQVTEEHFQRALQKALQ